MGMQVSRATTLLPSYFPPQLQPKGELEALARQAQGDQQLQANPPSLRAVRDLVGLCLRREGQKTSISSLEMKRWPQRLDLVRGAVRGRENIGWEEVLIVGHRLWDTLPCAAWASGELGVFRCLLVKAHYSWLNPYRTIWSASGQIQYSNTSASSPKITISSSQNPYVPSTFP